MSGATDVSASGAAAWIAERTPPAPDALASRLAARLGDEPAPDAAAIAAACVDGAAALLTDLLSSGRTSRDAALDLLAADALVTYAFEAAAEDPERIDALAREAMRRLSDIGTR